MRNSVILAIVALPAISSANGAMGLGLEMFHLGYWLIYVIAMIVFEAWWIGRRSGVGWGVSLGISLLGNLITAMLCSQLAAPALHQPVVGSRLNPNPLINAVILFLGYGLISAVLEAALWQSLTQGKRLLWRSIAAHFLSVPIALAILLIPEHPYVGLDAFTQHFRRWTLERWAKRNLQDQIQGKERIPSFASVDEAIRAIPLESEPDAWAAGYKANYRRFSVGEDQGTPYEWNRELNSKAIGGEDDSWIWLIRPPKEMYRRVIEVNLLTGEVRARSDE